MINERRVEACKRLGFPFYRGQTWFTRMALARLVEQYRSLDLHCRGGTWWVNVGEDGYATIVPSPIFEKALIGAMLTP